MKTNSLQRYCFNLCLFSPSLTLFNHDVKLCSVEVPHNKATKKILWALRNPHDKQFYHTIIRTIQILGNPPFLTINYKTQHINTSSSQQKFIFIFNKTSNITKRSCGDNITSRNKRRYQHQSSLPPEQIYLIDPCMMSSWQPIMWSVMAALCTVTYCAWLPIQESWED